MQLPGRFYPGLKNKWAVLKVANCLPLTCSIILVKLKWVELIRWQAWPPPRRANPRDSRLSLISRVMQFRWESRQSSEKIEYERREEPWNKWTEKSVQSRWEWMLNNVEHLVIRSPRSVRLMIGKLWQWWGNQVIHHGLSNNLGQRDWLCGLISD